MKSYIEFIQEDTAAQRLYKKKGFYKGYKGKVKKGDRALINYVENIEKQSYIEKIQKYKNDENVYISFRGFPLVGINPKSPYDTPNGVYCYPVKQRWNKILDNTLEYASETWKHPYVGIIKIKEGYTWNTANNDDTKILSSKLTNQTRLNKVCKDLAEYVINDCEDIQIKAFLEKMNSICNTRESGDYKYFDKLDFSRQLSTVTEENKDNPAAYGIKDCYDFIHKENYDKSFAIKIVESLLLKILEKHKRGKYKLFDIWSLTRELTVFKPGYKPQLTGVPTKENDYSTLIKRNSDVWAHILFKVLGFSMVINKKDEGIIYGNEPTQAVIFDPNCYEYELIDNNRKGNKQYIEKDSIRNKSKEDIEEVIKIHNHIKSVFNGKKISLLEAFRKNDIDASGNELNKFYDVNSVTDYEIRKIIYNNNFRKYETYNAGVYVNILSGCKYEDTKTKNYKELLDFLVLEKDLFKINIKKENDTIIMNYNENMYSYKDLTIANHNKNIKFIIKNARFSNSILYNAEIAPDIIKDCQLENCLIVSNTDFRMTWIENNTFINSKMLEYDKSDCNNKYENCDVNIKGNLLNFNPENFKNCVIHKNENIAVKYEEHYDKINEFIKNGNLFNFRIFIDNGKDINPDIESVQKYINAIINICDHTTKQEYFDDCVYYKQGEREVYSYLKEDDISRLDEFSEEKIKAYVERYKDEAIFEILKYVENK